MQGSTFRILLLITIAITLVACTGDDGTDTLLSEERLHLRGIGWETELVSQPPLHERGIKNVALIYYAENALHFEHIVGFFPSREHFQVPSTPWIEPSFGESVFLSLAKDKSVVDVQSYTRTHGAIVDGMTQSKWTGKYKFADNAKRLIDDLRAKDVDAILLIREGPLRDKYFDDITPGAKGIYSRSEFLAYAGFDDVVLIDPTTADIMRHGRYQQASLKELPDLVWKEGGFESYSLQEKALIVDAIKDRIRNNVEQILLLFKIIPIRENQYMTLDDLDDSEVVVYEYPE